MVFTPRDLYSADQFLPASDVIVVTGCDMSMAVNWGWALQAGAAVAADSADLENNSESDGPSVLMRGRHGISVSAGLLNRITVQNDVVDGTVRSEVSDTGMLVSLSYAYWIKDEWNVGVGVSLIDAGAKTSVESGEVTSESAAVTAVHFGVAYYPAALALSPSLRPYGSVAIGPWLGSATNSHVGTNVESKTVSESVLGLRVQAGMDMFFAGRFKAGIVAGYDLVSDFDEQIGSHRNYSGPLFAAGFGILLGAGR